MIKLCKFLVVMVLGLMLCVTSVPAARKSTGGYRRGAGTRKMASRSYASRGRNRGMRRYRRTDTFKRSSNYRSGSRRRGTYYGRGKRRTDRRPQYAFSRGSRARYRHPAVRGTIVRKRRTSWPDSLYAYNAGIRSGGYTRGRKSRARYAPRYATNRYAQRYRRPGRYYAGKRYQRNKDWVAARTKHGYRHGLKYRTIRRGPHGYYATTFLPIGCRTVVYKNRNYYYDGWYYYYPYTVGGVVWYEKCKPFEDVYIADLPPETVVVVVDGKTYYYHEGVYMVKTDEGFRVVENPLPTVEDIDRSKIAQR